MSSEDDPRARFERLYRHACALTIAGAGATPAQTDRLRAVMRDCGRQAVHHRPGPAEALLAAAAMAMIRLGASDETFNALAAACQLARRELGGDNAEPPLPWYRQGQYG